MPELSNLLRQRLGGAGTGPDSTGHPDLMPHPDADTLTAYVEQILPSAERQSVVTHLSVCALCREVVALSLPQLPELVAQGQASMPVSRRWGWLWTPGFRWAGAVAVVAVAAALVVELPRQHNGARSEFTRPQSVQPQGAQPEAAQAKAARAKAEQDSRQPNAATVSEQPAASSAGPVSSDKLARPAKSAKVAGVASGTSWSVASEGRAEARGVLPPGLKDMQPRAAMVASADLSANKETAGKQPGEEAKNLAVYVNNDLFANTNGAGFKYDSLPQASAPQLGNLQPGLAAGAPAQLSSFQGIPANANKKTKFISRMVPLSPLKDLCGILCKVVDVRQLAKTSPSSPAITTGTVNASAMEAPKLSSSLLRNQTQIAAAPEKAASGELARSEGAFAPRAEAAPGGARFRAGASARMHWKVEEGKLFKSIDLDQWQDAYPRVDANFEFSFVAAHGADVWAGGSHAELLHSRDGGTMWEYPKLGDSASGTIVSIVASGLSVQVKTSDNQSWSSSDAGKTWTRQD